MSRFSKQLFYGFFYLAVILGVGAFVYFAFVRPAPSCTNNRQDGGEEGIDCGGVCAEVCVPKDIASIETPDPILIFTGKQGAVELLAKIQNPNAGFAAKAFAYRFDLFDAEDNRIAAFPGESFVYAGEIKYLAAIEYPALPARAVRAELVIGPPAWEKADEFPRPGIGGIENKQFTNASGTLLVTGRVTNRDTITLPEAQIIAVFMGTSGSPLGVSRTALDSLAPGESRQFSIFHPEIEGAVIERTQIYAYGLRP